MTTLLVTTRFSDYTWRMNEEYRNRIEHNGCLYGSPQEINHKITSDKLLFVVEMNNTTNQILGIGLIRNRPLLDKYYKIYSDGNYNRFVYKGMYRITRDDLLNYDNSIVDILEYIVFKEKNHLKRGSGFTSITKEVIKRKKNTNYHTITIEHLIRLIKGCFYKLYKNDVNNNANNNATNNADNDTNNK
jgi:hypothetical protein